MKVFCSETKHWFTVCYIILKNKSRNYFHASCRLFLSPLASCVFTITSTFSYSGEKRPTAVNDAADPGGQVLVLSACPVLGFKERKNPVFSQQKHFLNSSDLAVSDLVFHLNLNRNRTDFPQALYHYTFSELSQILPVLTGKNQPNDA